MSATVKELIEGIVLQTLSNEISKVEDCIDILSEGRLVEMKDRQVTRNIGIDGNVVTSLDKYGDLPTTNSALKNYQDRSYISDTYVLKEPSKIGFVIPRQDLDLYGISKAILNAPSESLSKQDIAKLSAKIIEEWGTLRTLKMRNYRRGQLRDVLCGLGRTALDNTTTSATYNAPWFPLALKVIDTSALRTTAFAFTNKATAVLNTTTYKEVVNLFYSGQKNAFNTEYQLSQPLWLLHASDLVLAESIHMPNMVNETQMRTAGGTFVPVSAKSCGVYGDSTNTDDWIMLGSNHQIKRIYRNDAGSTANNGLSFRMYFQEDNGALVIELYNHSEIAIDSCLDIYKAVV